MSTKQNNNIWKVPGLLAYRWFAMIAILTLQIGVVRADESTINNLEFSSLGGNQVQVALDMGGPITEPKIFTCARPPRIQPQVATAKS